MRAGSLCTGYPGHDCTTIIDQPGRCPNCTTAANRRRPAQQGYDAEHRTRFRAAILKRDPTCVLCHQRPSRHADHWPLARHELEHHGLDPNDPANGRGLCHPCHSRETATHQPGGWNPRTHT